MIQINKAILHIFDFSHATLSLSESVMSDDNLSMERMLEMAMGLSMTSLFQQTMSNSLQTLNNQVNATHTPAPPRYIYAVIEGRQQGPFSLGEVVEYIRKGVITPQTYIWKQGMQDWLPAEQVKDLSPELNICSCLIKKKGAVALSDGNCKRSSSST